MMNKAMHEAVAHAIAEYPKESCGFIVQVDGEEAYLPCINHSLNPTEMFTLLGEDYLKAEDLGAIVAIVHSHPDGSPVASAADRRGCEMSGHPWRVIAVHKDGDEVSYAGESRIEPCNYVVPLRGRPFVHGILDCFTLLRDYYKMRLNIELPDFKREDNWWNKGQDLYSQNYAEAGFILAPTGIREHDVIIMQVRATVPNHGGIYIGDTKILHHLYGQLSREDIYGGYWQQVTTHVLRHKELL